jgi:uncharacterized protein (TIGR04222 family)
MNPLRRLPAVILLVVLAVLPIQAWLDVREPQVTVSQSAAGLRDLTWVGAVQPDGRLVVRITYDFGDDAERTLNIRVPADARFVTANGAPVPMDIGLYGEAVGRSAITVGYELPAAVRRFSDGAVLQRVGVDDGNIDDDLGLFPCPRCYLDDVGYGDVPVTGFLFVPGAAGVELSVTQLEHLRAEATDDAVRFVGVDPGGDAVGLLATLPASAVPDVALSDGSAAATVATVRADLRDADESLHSSSDKAEAGDIVTAVVLTVLFALLMAWIVFRMVGAARARRASRREAGDVDPSRDPSSPPSNLEPALAGIVVGAAGTGDRSLVAGALLSLAHRGVIHIEGVDSQRFQLVVPAGAQGATPFEEAVLAALRPQGQLTGSATLTGPPLWGPDGTDVSRRLRRIAVKSALSQRLLRLTLSAIVLLPVTIAMGVVALVGSDGLSPLGWTATLAGPPLAIVAAALTGTSLTGRGRAERKRWVAYGEWLRDNANLAEVGAPAVAIWGEVLPYAAVLGAAPVAARALSPRY